MRLALAGHPQFQYRPMGYKSVDHRRRSNVQLASSSRTSARLDYLLSKTRTISMCITTASDERLETMSVNEGNSQALEYLLVKQLRRSDPTTGMTLKSTDMDGVYILFFSSPGNWIAHATWGFSTSKTSVAWNDRWSSGTGQILRPRKVQIALRSRKPSPGSKARHRLVQRHVDITSTIYCCVRNRYVVGRGGSGESRRWIGIPGGNFATSSFKTH
jgi:hypothetical protein